jgi:hypothetical protein
MPIARLLRPLAVLAALSGGIVATAPASAQDRSGLAGPYLAARLAVRDGDHREAAAYFAQALRADPGNPLLISNAVFANAALGEWDIAANIAEDLPPGCQRSGTGRVW